MAHIVKRTLEGLLIVMLAVMVVLVFGNVVLRYGFNSGIDVSEELSRFLFVWLTFMGAALVLKEGGHLGVTGLIDQLPEGGKKLCRALSDVIGAACCGLLAHGAWLETINGMSNAAPVTSLPLGVVYLSAALGASAMTLIFLHSLWRLVSGSMSADELAGRGGEIVD